MQHNLDKRSQEIFSSLVEAYVETGEPVGSSSLSKRLGISLSPATIRNVMADLEKHGLLFSPHTSAGRVPTESGLKLFVHGLLEVGDVPEEDQRFIDKTCHTHSRNLANTLEEAISTLSGLSGCAGIVLGPKSEGSLKHVEFVPLSPGRAMVVTVTKEGDVENRVIEIPLGIPPSTLVEATNYLNAHIAGKSLQDAREEILKDLKEHKSDLNEISSTIIESGLANWSLEGKSQLIVRGQANLLQDISSKQDIAKVQSLFRTFDEKKGIIELLDAAIAAEGVQIFIGSDHPLFELSGSSAIIAPYKDQNKKIVGAVGVIGPARINYSRVIPLVDYTAKVVGRLVG